MRPILVQSKPRSWTETCARGEQFDGADAHAACSCVARCVTAASPCRPYLAMTLLELQKGRECLPFLGGVTDVKHHDLIIRDPSGACQGQWGAPVWLGMRFWSTAVDGVDPACCTCEM